MTKHTTHNPLLPSLLRGIYARVARQLNVDPSYVSRVARGERQSQEVSLALEKEMERVLERAKSIIEPTYPDDGHKADGHKGSLDGHKNSVDGHKDLVDGHKGS